jgi:hypothetical protein
VACKGRNPLITEYLKDISYNIYYVPNYLLPSDWYPNPDSVIIKDLSNSVWQGHMRCYYGHRYCLEHLKKPYGLIFEDDCVPNRDDWPELIEKGLELIPNKFDVLSYHGREWLTPYWDIQNFNSDSIKLLTPKPSNKEVWVFGSLAYLISHEGSEMFLDTSWDGYCTDFILANCFRFGLVFPSPFNHDNSQGSLIYQNK